MPYLPAKEYAAKAVRRTGEVPPAHLKTKSVSGIPVLVTALCWFKGFRTPDNGNLLTVLLRARIQCWHDILWLFLAGHLLQDVPHR